MLSALISSVVAQTHGVPPPNPLGLNTIGSTEQYTALKNTFGFDISSDAGQYSFELDAPPLFLDLARQDVGAAWRQFVSSEYHSQCLYLPTATEAWAGQCKETMSNFRDALNKFSAIYPPQGTRYKDDPWDVIQEDVAHQGYSRTGNLVDRLKRDESQGLAYWSSTVNPWIQSTLNTIGEYGDKYIFNDNRNPKWLDYVLLKGAITNDFTPIDSKTPFFPRFGTEALQNKQFWGTDARFGAKEGFDGYENLGLLFRVQLRNAFGEDDKEWYVVMGYTDLTKKVYGSFVCELKFHDLRKIIRMMWRTMSDNPQIMPLNWLSATISCPVGAVGCVNGKFLPLSASAKDLYNLQINGKRLLKEIFKNNADSKAWLKSLGWDDALIQLATSMALGGYYHVDYLTLDDTITMEIADTLMDSNNIAWDFIQRMGYIHDILLDYTLQSGTGASDATLNPIKDRVNALWVKFVRWCDTNSMLDLLKYKLDPYFPVGNETADRQLAPALPLSNIPFLVINTHGKVIPCVGTEDVAQCVTWTADQKYVNATMEVYENTTRNPPTLYNISIKAHGESSRQWPKKTFAIKFWNKYNNDTKNVKFLGLKDNDEFVLKGLYVDMTLNRDAFAYNMSRGMGMWAPRTQQSEMYLIQDNMEISYALHYKGVYTVTESISRGKGRIDIPKNGQDEVNGVLVDIPPGVGGVIFAVDKFDAAVDSFHTMPITKNLVTISYPGKKHLTDAQTTWAWTLLDDFETDMFGTEWLKTGEPGAWDRWIDLDSWAAYFIHAEMMKSVDAYRFSTYFWTEGANSTLKFGPPWDYDLSSGNTGWVVDLTGQVKQTHSWQYMWALTIATDIYTHEPQSIPQTQHTPCAADWFYRMLDVPEFKNRVESMFWDLRHTVLSEASIRAVIADQKAELKKGSNRNFATWTTLDRVDIWPHFPPPIETSWDGKWSQLEEYLVGRAQWLEDNIYGYIPHDNLAENTTCALGVAAPDCLNGFQTFPAPYANCNRDPMIGFWWVRSNWQSGLKFFANKTHAYNDGRDCSVLEYLHWEATSADPPGPVDCPIPGGPDGILPPYPPKNAPMKCGGGCGADAEDMTPSCLGTIQWLMNNWQSDPKFRAGGVDGTICSCQKYLHDKENKCPKVRGMDGESHCVANRCQRTPGTTSPTATWAPRAPTTKPTKSPTNMPSPAPTPHVGPATNCGDSTITEATCFALGKAKAAPTTSCTACMETECCVQKTCATGLSDWCETQTVDCQSEDPCQVLRNLSFPVNGAVTCITCNLTECCTTRTCTAEFTGKCPAGYMPRESQDEGGVGCKTCDAMECCKPEPRTCTKVNFPGPCPKGFRDEESNHCLGGPCTNDDCCEPLDTCSALFPMSEKCPEGMRRKNVSLGDEEWCRMCNAEECCLKIASPPDKVTQEESSSNGATIAAVVVVVLVLVGAAVGFMLWRRSITSGKQQYVGLNDDANAYQPPNVA